MAYLPIGLLEVLRKECENCPGGILESIYTIRFDDPPGVDNVVKCRKCNMIVSSFTMFAVRADNLPIIDARTESKRTAVECIVCVGYPRIGSNYCQDCWEKVKDHANHL